MCGISGFIDFNGSSTEEQLIHITDVLHHRGPDGSGYFFEKTNEAAIGLGHRRLSIIDLSESANQPMHIGDVVMVYNGEVYNFQELKDDLIAQGVSFFTASDTEVILQLYIREGKDFVKKLNGMFALVIYDKRNQTIFMCRDRAGVKPFYYYFDQGLFLFSSEMKGLMSHPRFPKQIDYNALSLFFQYGYIPNPYSIFQQTKKLEPACSLELHLSGKVISRHRYWDVNTFYNKPKLKLTEEEALAQLEKKCTKAFQYRMISDVPVGVFLSGGIDSTIVTSILQKNSPTPLKTFTIGSKDEEYNEADHAREIASYLGTDHTEYLFTEKDAINLVDDLATIYDEPYGDSSALPTLLVSKIAREKVTVALSADGGDELFAGYTRHQKALGYYHRVNKIPEILQPIIGGALSVIPPSLIPGASKAYRFRHKYSGLQDILKSKNDPATIMKMLVSKEVFGELEKVFVKDIQDVSTPFSLPKNAGKSPLDRLLMTDYHTYLADDILTKVDRATMHYSLEGREPLLDYELTEFVAQLPDQYKINAGEQKYILKKLLTKYVPRELWDRPKSGFGIPIMKWCRTEMKDVLLRAINEETLKKHHIFDVKTVIAKRDQYLNGKDDDFRFVWFMMLFQNWYAKWMS